MSELEQATEFNYFPTLTDPAFDRLLNEAKDVQAELDHYPDAPVVHVVELIRSLNHDWLYSEVPVMVSGRVRSTIEYEQTELPGDTNTYDATSGQDTEDALEECEFVVNEQQFLHSGFIASRENWPGTVGGERMDAAHYLVSLFFIRPVKIYDHTGAPNEDIMQVCKAGLDDVVIESTVISDEFAEIMAQESFARLTERIDSLMEQGATIADRLLLLRRLRMPRPSYTTLQEIVALQHYTEVSVGIEDEVMPFLLTLKPSAPLFGADDSDLIMGGQAGTRQLVKLTGITVCPRTRVSSLPGENFSRRQSSQQLETRLKFHIIQKESEFDTEEVEVRLRDIRDIENVRDYFNE